MASLADDVQPTAPSDSVPRNVILEGDALARLRELPDACVQTCVTSPPYWGLRDYGVPGQIGLEDSVDEWCARLVAVFRDVRRVLRPDGTCWVNCGDAYASNWPCQRRNVIGAGSLPNGKREARPPRLGANLKDKDLIGLPWTLAFALRADGWWLRSDICWHKPNTMPEAVTDRPTRAHEYIFLLTKSARYFYDASAITEPVTGGTHSRGPAPHAMSKTVAMGQGIKNNVSFTAATWGKVSQRNRRSVWTIPSRAVSEAHFATFPAALVHPCIAAGSGRGDLVLDPFSGAGTTALVARLMGRDYLGIELNPHYAAMSRRRIARFGRPLRPAPVTAARLPTLWGDAEGAADDA